MKFMSKLSLFAALVAAISGVSNAEKNPWKLMNSTSISEHLLKGPPRHFREKSFYVLDSDFENGKNVEFVQREAAKSLETVCASFDYYLNVPNHYGLHLVVIGHDDTKESDQTYHHTLWCRYGFNGDVWRSATVKVHLKANETLAFRAAKNDGTVAFTPLEYDRTSGRCAMSNYDTDFEADDDNWQAVGTDVFKPAHLVFMTQKDKKSDSTEGRIAHLKYPTRLYNKNPLRKSVKCMTFWYNQVDRNLNDGVDSAVGNIQVKIPGGKTLWTSSDKLAWRGKWVQAAIPLNFFHNAGNYLTLESFPELTVNQTANYSSVLVDNIRFSDHHCPEEISCFFSDSTCGWVNAHENSLEWSLGNGRSRGGFGAINETDIPISDAGIYTDFRSRSGSPVEIRSPFMPESSEFCATIKILYNRIHDGDSVFSLIHIVETEEFEERTVLWRLNAKKASKLPENEYHAEEINVQVPQSFFHRRLALSAYSSFSETRMAVKAIKLVHGRCPAN